MLELTYVVLTVFVTIAGIWLFERSNDRRRARQIDFDRAASQAIALTRIPKARRPGDSEQIRPRSR